MQENDAVYEFDTRIRYSEVGHGGCMTLPALINLFQDCSIFHSEAVGYGPARLKREHKAWVLTHWQLVVDRYPTVGESVTVGTFASGFKSVSATRNFYLRNTDSTLIARAKTSWAFMDLVQMRPVRPTADHVEAYGMHDPLPMPPEERHVSAPDQLMPCEPVTVQRHHIDTNEHVNNCQYVQIALDLLPEEPNVHLARVDFRRSAVLGDRLFPSIARVGEHTIVQLCDADGSVFGIIELA